MNRLLIASFLSFVLMGIFGSGCQPVQSPDITESSSPDPTITATDKPAYPATSTPVDTTTYEATQPIPTSSPTSIPPAIPYDLISQDSLFAYLEDLTSIQPYSGWRNSASSGESEALEYVAQKLGEFSELQSWGMALERENFKVFLSTEFWETRLHLTVEGQEIEVPADGLRAARYSSTLASNLDSDGLFNDSDHDPLVTSGSPLIIRDVDEFYALSPDEVKGQVLFVDFALVDKYSTPESDNNGAHLVELIDQGMVGLVLVTQFSNQAGESHGTVVGDGSIFQYFDFESHIPILYARLEDLGPAGIYTWDDLEHIESANLTWDVDVYHPGQSGNLIARIPGLDPSQAVILGAHIDSPNSPGAFDDGSGSAALLEIARVLNQSKVQPDVDLYLAWFGGHEIGIYGSAHFVSTHQELLDRTLAMLQFDCLARPLDGNQSEISLGLTSYGRFGEHAQPWPDFLSQSVAPLDLKPESYVEYGLIADNSNFDAFNVPNVNMIYINIDELHSRGSGYIHYSGHLHDPYETVELAREVGDAFEGMTKVALAAALETGRVRSELRVSPKPERQALFVASHMEFDSIATTMLTELGMALAWEGFDVDMIPYGQTATQADLDTSEIVVLLPTMSYPGTSDNLWSESELALLEKYVADGGLLLVTNSNKNLVMTFQLDAFNGDIFSLNDFLAEMGIRFQYGTLDGDIAFAVGEHPLTQDAGYLAVYRGNGVPFKMDSGTDLAQINGRPIIGLVDYGDQGGQVLVIADLGLLKDNFPGAKNMDFVKNIAIYARSR